MLVTFNPSVLEAMRPLEFRYVVSISAGAFPCENPTMSEFVASTKSLV